MANILILAARFYEDIADMLITEARAELEQAGHLCEVIAVPGAFEIPTALALAIDSGKYDGYVALGCVIRGETTHYDYVCGESARGINTLAIQYRLPVGYGILTVENRSQAERRAAPGKNNKGADAARACMRMLALKNEMERA